MTPHEFDDAVTRGKIAPLYYLYGNEPFLAERALRKLLNQVIDPSFQDFNLNQFYGNECHGGEIVQSAQTLPMFSPWRVVLIKRASDLSLAALDTISPYLASPSPTTCFICVGEKIDLRKKFYLDFKKFGFMVEFKRPYENQLAPFVKEESALAGKNIEAAAVDLLVYLSGNNLREIVSQIEKIATYIGPRKHITLADVKTIASDTNVDSVFDLANALGEKNLSKSIRNLHTILRDGEPPIMLLALITRHFRQLWQVRELLDAKMPHPEIGKVTGIAPYFLKGILSQAKNFKVEEYIRTFENFYRADWSLKSGGANGVGVLERLAIEVCAVKGK